MSVGTGNRKTLLFTRTMLDEFQVKRRPSGNPNLMDGADPQPLDPSAVWGRDITALARRIEAHSPQLARDLLDIVDGIRAGKYD